MGRVRPPAITLGQSSPRGEYHSIQIDRRKDSSSRQVPHVMFSPIGNKMLVATTNQSWELIHVFSLRQSNAWCQLCSGQSETLLYAHVTGVNQSKQLSLLQPTMSIRLYTAVSDHPTCYANRTFLENFLKRAENFGSD